jgi:hypothetical protein
MKLQIIEHLNNKTFSSVVARKKWRLVVVRKSEFLLAFIKMNLGDSEENYGCCPEGKECVEDNGDHTWTCSKAISEF